MGFEWRFSKPGPSATTGGSLSRVGWDASGPDIYEIKKFLIIAESSCGSTWQ
jgi:hypothetical protein